jgi:CRP/FNR family transcriptional regulator, cyclic AMP receptor protein
MSTEAFFPERTQGFIDATPRPKMCNFEHFSIFGFWYLPKFSKRIALNFRCNAARKLGKIFIHRKWLRNMKRAMKRFFDSGAFLTQVGPGRHLLQFRKKQVIFSQGDAANAVYFIQKGKVRLSVVSKHGKEATLALMGAGDFVGEECVAASQPLRFTTATAISDGALLVIKKRTMLALLKEHAFSDVFVSFLLARNARFQEDLTDQLFNSSEKRLARVLLQLSQIGKDGPPENVVPKITQEMLAEMVGTTRARVSFFMNRFRKMGFIHYNGGLQVHNSLLNVVLHD